MSNLEFILSEPMLLIAIILVGTIGWCMYLRFEADEAIWRRREGEDEA